MPVLFDGKVCAKPEWFDTGIDVTEGQALTITASGTWVDLWIRSGPEGQNRWFMRLAWVKRRHPEANWFCLMAGIDQDKATVWAVGRGDARPAPRTGRLYLFANDAPGYYGNNKGAVDVTITSP